MPGKDRPRVLLLVGTLEAGGLERYVTRIALEAKKHDDFTPVICCLNRKTGLFLDPLRSSGVEIFEAPAGWARSVSALRRFVRLIAEIAPDIVHSQVNFSLLQQLVAVRASSCTPFCVTERNCYPLKGPARIRRLIQYRVLKLAGARYTANSLAVQAHLSKLMYEKPERFPVLRNGVPLNDPDDGVRREIRGRLGLSEDDVVIGYVSRMAPHKGHSLFLEAFSRLNSTGSLPKACFVGDGPERTRIEALSDMMGIENRVIFAGIVNNVEEYLHAFDIVALFSSYEGMPNAVLEAMAAGKAVVASTAGAIPELLNSGRAGMLVEGSCADDFARGLATVVHSPELRRSYGEKARERAQSLFSIEAAYTSLRDFYNSILRSSKAREHYS